MKASKIFLNAVLIALIALLVSVPLVWAGAEGGAPPDWENVTGPEIWGTAVVRCDPNANVTNFIAIRVKRIKDCNVLTDATIITPLEIETACPDTGNAFLYQRLDAGQLFSGDPDVPQSFKPIVTKVKNFAVHSRNADGSDALLSFDAQIKFVDE